MKRKRAAVVLSSCAVLGTALGGILLLRGGRALEGDSPGGEAPEGAEAVDVDSPEPLFGSSLASERPLRREYAEEVEALLAEIEARAPSGAEVRAVVDWEVPRGFALEWARDSLGAKTYTSGLAWAPPEGSEGFWPKGTSALAVAGVDFELERLAEDGRRLEWWRKAGEHFYASRLLEALPFTTRWRAAEALESDIIAYGEGLGLFLWALRPGEFLRRAEHLEARGAVHAGGRTFLALVATPDWIARPPTLPDKPWYPYHDSTLSSWAEHTPVITYYVDPATYRIEGARMEYRGVTWSHRGRWTAGAAPPRLVLEAWVKRWAVFAEGIALPAETESACTVGDELRRRVRLVVREASVAEGVLSPLSDLLPEPGRRPYEGWPPYRSEVYRSRIEAGAGDYANRVGLVRALAFEGDLAGALAELKALLNAFESDKALLPESLGGIDWHLGIAVYEILQRPESPECAALFRDFPPTEPFSSILARAVDFYARWHRAEDEARVAERFAAYERSFGLKARLLYVLDRPLLEGLETEVERALELRAIVRGAKDRGVALAALQAAVESYLREGDTDGALEALEEAERALGAEAFGELGDWEQGVLDRVAEEIEAREEAARASKLGAAKDAVRALSSALEDAARRGWSEEAGRYGVLLERARERVRELGGEL